jgi:hypothetical protein
MESQIEKFYFTTQDKADFAIDKRIKNFSKVFEHLIEDYNNLENNRPYDLPNIFKNDIILLLNFVEILNYDHDYIKLIKPFCLKPIDEVKKDLFEKNDKLKDFYDNLFSENIISYAEMADFLDVSQLEDLLYLKLGDVFSSENNIKNFFGSQLNGSEVTNISKDKKKILKDKYFMYCERFVKQLTDSEVEEILLRELNI